MSQTEANTLKDEIEIDMTEYGYERQDLERYCTDQIRIPAKFPNILKQFVKAAMKTQPRDLLEWSSAYFHAMADGETPPVKDHLEYPQDQSKDGLTVGYIRIINNLLGGRDIKGFSKLRVRVEDAREKWVSLCLDGTAFDEMIEFGKMEEKADVNWKRLLGIMAGSIGRNLTETMKVVCEALTEQPHGVDAMIPYLHFWDIYSYLAKLDGGISKQQLHEVNEYLIRKANKNFCLIGPKEFLDPKCPPLY